MATSTLPVATFMPQLEKAKAEVDRLRGEVATLTAAEGSMRDEAPPIDTESLAKNSEHRAGPREHIRRRVESIVVHRKFMRVRVKGGGEIDIFDKERIAVDIRGNGQKTKIVDEHKRIAALV